VLTVTATQNAQAVEIDSDAGPAIEANSNDDILTISVNNIGAGAAIATSAGGGPGVSASSHAGPGLIAVSDLQPGVVTYGTGDNALVAVGVNQPAINASSDVGVAVTAISEFNNGVVAQSTYGDAIVGYGNQKGAAGVFSNIHVQPRLGGGSVAIYQAAEFVGNVTITGSFSVSGAKGFRIDHPLQPKKKWLHHAAVESDVMKNLYDGIASLNSDGEAVVSLPSWFEALNKDIRYQLTPIGAPGPSLHIAREIRGGKFRIAGGKPRAKVSWQVTGVRKDAWASTYPFVTEVSKSAKERGTQICPTAVRDRRGLRAVLSPSVYERIEALDKLKEASLARKARFSAMKKGEQKRRRKK
jgi:hypothetical protein